MKPLQILRRKITLGWSAVGQIFGSIADQTALQMEIMKLSFQIVDHERRLDGIYEKTGRFLYEGQLKGMEPDDLSTHSVCRSGLEDMEKTARNLKYLEKEHYTLKEPTVSHWASFVASVKKTGMTVDSMILPPDHRPASIMLKDLSLPQGVLVIIIQRKERFIQAHGDVVLKRGDRLTLLGPPSQVSEVIQRFPSRPH